MSHPSFVDDLVKSCVGCRSCQSVCPSFRHGGCSPFSVFNEGATNVDLCIGCGKCNTVCKDTDPKTAMSHLKVEKLDLRVPETFIKHGLMFPPVSEEDLSDLPDVRKGEDVYIMPGCVVKGKVPFLMYSALKAFEVLGIGADELPKNTCCMYSLPLSSIEPREKDKYKFAMRKVAAGRDMVALCSGCTVELARSAVYAPHLVTYLPKYLERIKALPGVDLKVSLEPGCSCERYMKDFIAIVEATGATIVNKSYGCCGKNVPEIADRCMEDRFKESEGADVIILGCPNCFVFYDNHPKGMPVLYIAELIALAAGDRETQRYHRIKLKDHRTE
ncbi:MAG: (Fe-S)-binding protein [archaeon]|nr:(Fe-S)-binding protein [archaeon]